MNYKAEVSGIYEGQYRCQMAESASLWMSCWVSKYSRRSQRAKEQICALAADTTYRNVAVLETHLTGYPISPSKVCRTVKEVGNRINVQNVAYEADEPGTVQSQVLFGESDGVWIPLQGEKEKKVEIRAAVMYTGKKAINGGRKKLQNKRTFIAVLNGKRPFVSRPTHITI